MSYAQVAAHNAPPSSEQPRPDPSLLNTSPPSAPTIIDDTSKVNLVHPSLKGRPITTASKERMQNDKYSSSLDDDQDPKKIRKSRRMQEVEAEGAYLWQVTKRYLFRPGVAGGFVGLVNIGIIAAAGRAFYNDARLRSDRKVISSAIVATLALLTVEGYAAERYRQTPRGQEEERRAKKEGTLIYKHLQEVVLRPGVLGGLLGFVNAAVLGTVAYHSYVNWDRPSWDRRTVSAITVGLITLVGGEGFLAERSRSSKRL